MSKLLLNLRNVPDDEADDVRGFLDANRIDHYDTPPGPFGISAGGIWIRDTHDLPRAKQLMADYQRERLARVRAGGRRPNATAPRRPSPTSPAASRCGWR